MHYARPTRPDRLRLLVCCCLLLAAAPLVRANGNGGPLRIDQTYLYNEGRDGLSIQVRLSHPVAIAELREHVVLEPPVENLRVEPKRWGAGCEIFGDFAGDTVYELILTAGLTDERGRSLDTPLTHLVSIDDIPPWLGFDLAGAYYMPRDGGPPLNLEYRNIDSVEFTVYRLFPSNIVLGLDAIEQDRAWELANWSEELLTRELAVHGPADRVNRTPVELRELLPGERNGVFVLMARADDRNRSAQRILLMTGIGALAHWDGSELILFAHNLNDLSPVQGARVTVYSQKNQVLGEGRTDRMGIAQLRDFQPSLGRPAVAVIEGGNDYTFLALRPRSIDSDYHAPYGPADWSERYDAFIYGDRDLYRPGETVRLRWLVRRNYGDAVANVPLKLTVHKPNGREWIEHVTQLDALGADGLDIDTDAGDATGRYQVMLTVPGANRTLGSYSFSLEEFVPARMRASIEVPVTGMVAGETYPIAVRGEFLSGGAAADRKAEAEVIVRGKGYRAEAWPGYVFENDTPAPTPRLSCGEARTDAEGRAEFTFRYQPGADVTMPLIASASGTVFELGGRAVAARERVVLFPSEVALGLAVAPSAGANGVDVSAVAIGPDERPTTAVQRVFLTLERRTWAWYTRRYTSHNETNWSQAFEEIETREVALNDGVAAARFDAPGYGYYRVRVHAPETPQFSSRMFYSYGGECGVVDPARPSLIKLTPDRERYTIGQTAEVRIEAPYAGKAFIVAQGDRLEKSHPLTLQDGVATVNLRIDRRHFPGVWLQATVVQSIDADPLAGSPFSSFAMVYLPVDDPGRRLEVDLVDLPAEIRPAREQTFAVRVRDAAGNPVRRAHLTLAAVDEGIHILSGYDSPSPYAWLTRKRPRPLNHSHYYDKVAYEPPRPTPGGDAGEIGKRLSEAQNWIRTVALWSGEVATDADGLARVTLAIPEYSGELRLDAVAWTAEAVGSAGDALKVRRLFDIETSQPRFMLTGDRCTALALLRNRTPAWHTAHLTWLTSGTLNATSGTAELELPPEGEAARRIDVQAADRIGPGHIAWRVEIRDHRGEVVERLGRGLLLPVNPPATFQTEHRAVVLEPGSSRTLTAEGFAAAPRVESELTVGADLLLRLQRALEFVVGYPYGCVEQTTSRLMPLYLLRSSRALTGGVLERPEDLDRYIRGGIERLFAMQVPGGGLAFWPGGDQPSPYGSVYALHALTLIANDRALELPEGPLAALRDFARAVSRDFDGRFTTPYLRAYALYVLALGGDLESIRALEALSRMPLTAAARYWLAAALARATGDAEQARALLEAGPVARVPGVQREPFDSPIRDRAIRLIALQQLGDEPDKRHALAEDLIRFLERPGHGTTHENAFVIAALADYLREVGGDLSEARAVVARYAEGRPPAFTADDLRSILAGDDEPLLGGHAVTVISGGEVHRDARRGPDHGWAVYNAGPTPLFVNHVLRGIPLDAPTAPLAQGLRIDREVSKARGGEPLLNTSIAELTSTTLAHTETYIVALRLKAPQALEHVIVVDPLPAGFEILNPRLNPDNLPGGHLTGAITPSHMELRDDRVVLALDRFDPAAHVDGRAAFYYLVRAVTPGVYRYPPATAECMYDPAVRARTAPANLTIE